MNIPRRGFIFCSDKPKCETLITSMRATFVMCTVDFDGAIHKKELLKRIVTAVGAPQEYVEYINFDSLYEILRDLSWSSITKGLLVEIKNSSRQWEINYETMASLLEIFSDVSLYWRDKNIDVLFMLYKVTVD